MSNIQCYRMYITIGKGRNVAQVVNTRAKLCWNPARNSPTPVAPCLMPKGLHTGLLPAIYFLVLQWCLCLCAIHLAVSPLNFRVSNAIEASFAWLLETVYQNLSLSGFSCRNFPVLGNSPYLHRKILQLFHWWILHDSKAGIKWMTLMSSTLSLNGVWCAWISSYPLLLPL